MEKIRVGFLFVLYNKEVNVVLGWIIFLPVRSGLISNLQVWKFSPKTPQIFIFFAFGSKKISVHPVKKLSGSKPGQKYAQVGPNL